MLVLAVTFILTSLLLIALAIPMIQEKVKPNWWYGFRVPKTVNNPHIWYPANKYAGWWMVGMGGLILALSIILLPVPGINVDVYSSIIGGVMGIYAVVMLIALFRYLGKLS